jgi:hypothetical protein
LIDRLNTSLFHWTSDRIRIRDSPSPQSHRARWWGSSHPPHQLISSPETDQYHLHIFVKLTLLYVGFEVLTAVVMGSTIFWDITQCSPLNVNRRFGGAYCLHLQGRISRARYQRESRWHSDYVQSTRVFKICIMVFWFILRLWIYIACNQILWALSLKKTLKNKEFRFLSGFGYLKYCVIFSFYFDL